MKGTVATFADETALFYERSNTDYVINKMNSDLKLIK